MEFTIDPAIRVGLVVGDGGGEIWPHLLGHQCAKEYLMTGDIVTGPEAERIGLVNHCAPHAELDARLDAFADRLAETDVQSAGRAAMSRQITASDADAVRRFSE